MERSGGEEEEPRMVTMVTAMGMTGPDPPLCKALSLRYVTGCQSEPRRRGLTDCPTPSSTPHLSLPGPSLHPPPSPTPTCGLAQVGVTSLDRLGLCNGLYLGFVYQTGIKGRRVGGVGGKRVRWEVWVEVGVTCVRMPCLVKVVFCQRLVWLVNIISSSPQRTCLKRGGRLLLL